MLDIKSESFAKTRKGKATIFLNVTYIVSSSNLHILIHRHVPYLCLDNYLSECHAALSAHQTYTRTHSQPCFPTSVQTTGKAKKNPKIWMKHFFLSSSFISIHVPIGSCLSLDVSIWILDPSSFILIKQILRASNIPTNKKDSQYPLINHRHWVHMYPKKHGHLS